MRRSTAFRRVLSQSQSVQNQFSRDGYVSVGHFFGNNSRADSTCSSATLVSGIAANRCKEAEGYWYSFQLFEGTLLAFDCFLRTCSGLLIKQLHHNRQLQGRVNTLLLRRRMHTPHGGQRVREHGRSLPGGCFKPVRPSSIHYASMYHQRTGCYSAQLIFNKVRYCSVWNYLKLIGNKHRLFGLLACVVRILFLYSQFVFSLFFSSSYYDGNSCNAPVVAFDAYAASTCIFMSKIQQLYINSTLPGKKSHPMIPFSYTFSTDTAYATCFVVAQMHPKSMFTMEIPTAKERYCTTSC